MTPKNVYYYPDLRGRVPVWEFLWGLSGKEREKCFEYIAFLEEAGEEVRRPVGDYLREKVYELRPGQIRILYFLFLGKHAVLLHAFRKTTRAVSKRDFKLAKSRMQDFIRRYENQDLKF